MKIIVLGIFLCPAVAVAAEEVYQQPEPPRYEAVRVAEACDHEMWVTIYRSALASRATPEQARARASAVAHGCARERLIAKR